MNSMNTHYLNVLCATICRGAPVCDPRARAPNVNSNERHCRKERAVMQKRSCVFFRCTHAFSICCETYEHAQGTILHICLRRIFFSCESFTRKFWQPHFCRRSAVDKLRVIKEKRWTLKCVIYVDVTEEGEAFTPFKVSC